MNKIFMLGFANIRKTKGQTITLIVLFLISSMMLNIGFTVSLNFVNFFDKTARELNSPDAYYLIPEYMYTNEVVEYIDNCDEITDYEREKGILVPSKTDWDGKKIDRLFLFFDMNNERQKTKWKYIDEKQDYGENSVYLPYIFKVSGGYSIGDTLTVETEEKSYDFIIAGYTEDILFSSTDMGVLSLYIPSGRFEALSEELSNNLETLVYANVKQNFKSVETKLIEMTGASSSTTIADTKTVIAGFDLELVKLPRTMMAVIISAMMVVFSAIIVVICLLVIRFRIGNSIEEDMMKIGSLKSIGYTSSQISLSIAAQYCMIALIGCILGVLPAYMTLPAVSDVFALQTGLLWRQGFEPVLNLMTIGALLLIVLSVTLAAAFKIKKISTVAALRGGITTHSFKRNHVSLDKSRLPLSSALSFKSMLCNIKQSIMMLIIMTAVAFTGTFAVIMYYNAVIDTKAFAEIPGMELSNVAFVFDPDSNPEKITSEIAALENVRKAQYIDETKLLVDGNDLNIYVMSDFSTKEVNVVYKGRYPIHDNEIAVAGAFSEKIGKTVGDTVTIGKSGEEKNFIITGLTQGSSGNSMLKAFVTLDGIKQTEPDFKQMNLNVYLIDGEDVEKFIENIKSKYSDKLMVAVNVDEALAQGMGSYQTIVSLIGEVILIVSFFVIILVLYFIIGSSVIRKRRELGIQKALGFTTVQLMNQISLGFLFPILTGTVAGCLLGSFLINEIMVIPMRAMAVMKTNFISSPAWIITFGAGMLIISYITSMLITSRIRKISAYALVTE